MSDLSDQRLERLRLNLKQLEVFVATARAGSTRAAADRVSRSQSAASSALADLEAALGAQLFDRVGRRLVINENGRALLPKTVALLDQAADLQHLFDAEHAVPLRVAASLTIGEYLAADRRAVEGSPSREPRAAADCQHERGDRVGGRLRCGHRFHRGATDPP